jgi:hypothetical protein
MEGCTFDLCERHRIENIWRVVPLTSRNRNRNRKNVSKCFISFSTFFLSEFCLQIFYFPDFLTYSATLLESKSDIGVRYSSLIYICYKPLRIIHIFVIDIEWHKCKNLSFLTEILTHSFYGR